LIEGEICWSNELFLRARNIGREAEEEEETREMR